MFAIEQTHRSKCEGILVFDVDGVRELRRSRVVLWAISEILIEANGGVQTLDISPRSPPEASFEPMRQSCVPAGVLTVSSRSLPVVILPPFVRLQPAMFAVSELQLAI